MQLTIKTPEKFTFNSHPWFHAQTKKLDVNTEITLDFNDTTYIDSSALGMILLLRDKFNKPVKLINCKGTVMSVLEIAQFKKLFSIS